MENEKAALLINDSLRHNEYYDLQDTFDDLYKRSLNGETFSDLMSLILTSENIALAYRNIKTNKGKNTPGVDGVLIRDIGKLSVEEVVNEVKTRLSNPDGYRPDPVKRVEIPKPGTDKKRPLGIPTAWDKLIQQAIRQVLEPICEARFCEYSNGFRIERDQESAISQCHRLINTGKNYYVAELDIKGYFDNVTHKILREKLWGIGIRDKVLLFILNRMLKAPILHKDGTLEFPQRGVPQGGVLSTLLSNVYLNTLDQKILNMWRDHPVSVRYSVKRSGKKAGKIERFYGYKILRKREWPEVYFVRFADDVRVFAKKKKDILWFKDFIAVWLKKHLKLELSLEKTRIVDVRKKSMEFLGLTIKAVRKKKKWVSESHMSPKAIKKQSDQLARQLRKIARPPKGDQSYEIMIFNSQVSGMHNYYSMASHISKDVARISGRLIRIMACRLKKVLKRPTRDKLKSLTDFERKTYGNSGQLRFIGSQPIYPVGYCKTRKPMDKPAGMTPFSEEGRKKIHKKLDLSLDPVRLKRDFEKSLDYYDNRISRFSAQKGKCAITGLPMMAGGLVHAHHIIPRKNGGDDSYNNLICILPQAHRLVHAVNEETVRYYLNALNVDSKMLEKVNSYREKAGNKPIPARWINK